MSKQCVIQQGAGLGDIFFSQKVAFWYRAKGYEIIWPVSSAILWLQDYIPNITWVEYWDWRNSHPEFMNYGITETSYGLNVNVGDSHHSHGGKIMASKIEMCGISWQDWATYLHFIRKHDKENELFYNVLGLKDGDKYVFRNCMYSTPPDIKRFDFDIDTELPIIDLQMIEGYTLIDWGKVVEKATQIHIIDTAINYLMEVWMLDSEYTVVRAARNKSEIDYLFTKQDVMI